MVSFYFIKTYKIKQNKISHIKDILLINFLLNFTPFNISNAEYIVCVQFYTLEDLKWNALRRSTRNSRKTLPINELKGNPPKEDCPILNLHRCKIQRQ